MNRKYILIVLACIISFKLAICQNDSDQVKYKLDKFILPNGDTIASLQIIAIHDNTAIARTSDMPTNAVKNGYVQNVDIDLLKIATKVIYNDSSIYALHVKGINMPRAGIWVKANLTSTARIEISPLADTDNIRYYDNSMNTVSNPIPLTVPGYNDFLIKISDINVSIDSNSIRIKHLKHYIYKTFSGEVSAGNKLSKIPSWRSFVTSAKSSELSLRYILGIKKPPSMRAVFFATNTHIN